MKRSLLPALLVCSLAAPVAFAQDAKPLPSELSSSTLEAKLAVLDREIASAQKELETIGPRRTHVAARGRLRGRRLYKLTRAGLLPLGGGFSSFVDHAQQVERLRRAVLADLDEESRLSARQKALTTSLGTMTKDRAETADRKSLVDAARVAIDEERRRREAFERAFAESHAPRASGDGEKEIVVYGPTGKVSPDAIEAGSFRARKGRLTFPVAGEAEVKPTTREGGPAVEIKAPPGAVVRATHPGRVAFADRYGTYGSLVILDHGDRCWTVSGNLGSLDVKVGDEVSAGERIGTVGASSANAGGPDGDTGRGGSLYFEIRVGSEKVAPKIWLGL